MVERDIGVATHFGLGLGYVFEAAPHTRQASGVDRLPASATVL
jgi:hypothetical protein